MKEADGSWQAGYDREKGVLIYESKPNYTI